MEIVAVVGQKGSGKSEFAKVFSEVAKENSMTMKTMKFATPLKDMLRIFYASNGLNPDEIEERIEGSLKDLDDEKLQLLPPRKLMVTLGTEWGRDLIDQEIWSRTLKNKITSTTDTDFIVVDDCRFINEYNTIKSLPFKSTVLRIWRESLIGGNHQSETEMSEIPFDLGIENSSTIQDFHEDSKTMSRIIINNFKNQN